MSKLLYQLIHVPQGSLRRSLSHGTRPYSWDCENLENALKALSNTEQSSDFPALTVVDTTDADVTTETDDRTDDVVTTDDGLTTDADVTMDSGVTTDGCHNRR